MSSDFWGREKSLQNDMGMSVGEDKPKIGQEYFYLIYEKSTVKVLSRKWQNDNVDMLMYMTDNIYSSKDKAESDKERFENGE